ncbi:MAG: DUF4153 domain-containing protein [Alphaproteobacteria bacterium]|nr:DUF4153 domain-containing protein [Alphaproteobacteria bacterium]
MEQKRPRWVDKPEFDWTPQPPLRIDPTPSPWDANQPVIVGARFAEPAPDFVPANDAFPPGLLGHVRRAFGSGIDQLVGHAWALGTRPGDAAGWSIAPRLAIGLGQGVLLSLLFFARDSGLGNSVILAGLIMAAAFAPLLAVQGLGRIALRPLLAWTGLVAAGLLGLGAYHAWRIAGSDPGHAGLWLAILVAVFLFIGQALLLAHARSTPLRYAMLYESSWRLAVESLLCGCFALCAWAACNTVAHLIASRPLPLWLVLPLITVSFAAASQLRAGSLLHLLKRGAVIAFTFLLPPLIFFATVTILFGVLSRWQPPLALCGLEGLLLVTGINASYRGGDEWRPLWRRRAEFLAAFLLPPLALLGVLALQSRVAQYGFTGPRIIAMAAMFLFIAYALTYAGAALISLGGGRWMARIERANLPMAFVVMSLCATLASPLGDPVRLAVANQNWRMLHGRVAPEAFDYAYLSQSGLRFGRAVLEGPR